MNMTVIIKDRVYGCISS